MSVLFNININSKTIQLKSDGKFYDRNTQVNIPINLASLLKGKGPNSSINVKIEDINYAI